MAADNGRFWMTEEWSFAVLRALSMLGGLPALFLAPVVGASAANLVAAIRQGASTSASRGKPRPSSSWRTKSANFTDARRMLAGTRALYTAKIRRDGMGTGMPYWANTFTEGELAALVDYLWTFSLNRQE